MELVEIILFKGKENWSSRGECPRSGLNYLANFFGSIPYESVFHRMNIVGFNRNPDSCLRRNDVFEFGS